MDLRYRILIMKGGNTVPFNKDINGFKNEREFCEYLHNKKVKQVNPIFQDLLYTLYGSLTEEEIIHAYINYNKQKSDLYITISGVTKGISIKKGIKNSVHIEPIQKFVKFLKAQNIPDEIINEVLKYHYADGTTDGTGKMRISSGEYKELYQDKLDLINSYFSKENIVRKAINRFVLVGNNSDKSIDAIIYGVIDDFVWITKDEIIDIILKYKDIKRTGLSFGPLFYQPMNRCLNYNPKYEYAREYIQIKWYHLSDAIIEIMSQRPNSIYQDTKL